MRSPFPLFLALFAITVVAHPTWAAEHTEPAEKFAQRFYGTLLKQKPLGLPDDKQWTALKPFFAPDVVAAMEKAKREEAAAAKKHPDEPPVYGDGWLFCSLYEGPTQFAVGKGQPGSKETRVPITLTYRSGKEHTEWTDTLVLVPAGTGWRVTQIEFGGKWAFKSGSGLRQAIGLKR